MQACVQCGSRFMNPYSVRRDRDTKKMMRNRVQSKKACGAIVSARISNTELQYCQHQMPRQTARATKCQVHDRAISVLSTLLHAIKDKRKAIMIINGIIGKNSVCGTFEPQGRLSSSKQEISNIFPCTGRELRQPKLLHAISLGLHSCIGFEMQPRSSKRCNATD